MINEVDVPTLRDKVEAKKSLLVSWFCSLSYFFLIKHFIAVFETA